MGSDFYSFEEASIRLKSSKRTIYNYVKKGLIRKIIKDGKVVLQKEDVEQVAKDIEVDAPPITRKTILQLHARVQRLEQDMAVCRRMFNIRGEPLQFSRETAIAFYQAIIKALEEKTYSIEEISTWADLLDRLDENSLETISQATANKSSWESIYKLCLRFIKQVSENGSQDRELFMKLDEGRKRLRGTVLMWLEMGYGKLPSTVIESLGSERERLLMKLAPQKCKSL